MEMPFDEFLNRSKLLPIEKLKKLSTPRFLTYFKKHRYKDFHNVCYCGCGEKIYNTDYDLHLEKYFNMLREELNKREHVEK
jgi:hypothetical protein